MPNSVCAGCGFDSTTRASTSTICASAPVPLPDTTAEEIGEWFVPTADTVETILRRGLFDAGAVEVNASRFCLSTPTPAHGHDFLEMAVVSDGRGVHESQDGRTGIASGAVVLVRPGQWHGYVECDSLVVDNLYVGPGVAQKCFGWVHDVPAVAHLLAASRSVRKLHLDPDALERVVGWLGQLSASPGPNSDKGQGSDAVRIGLLLAVLGEVASTSSIVASPPTRPDVVEEALRLLGEQGRSRVVAGGVGVRRAHLAGASVPPLPAVTGRATHAIPGQAEGRTSCRAADRDRAADRSDRRGCRVE